MKKRQKKAVKIFLLSLLGVFVISAMAVGCGRSFRGHHDPEKVRKYVLWKVNDRLDDIDATDYQRQAVVGATEKIMADMRSMKEKGESKSKKLQIISELERGVPKAEEYHRLLDEKIDSFRDFAHRTLDEALKAFMTLDNSQRKELLEDVREHVEEHHS